MRKDDAYSARSEDSISPKLSLQGDINDALAVQISLGSAKRFPTVGELYQGRFDDIAQAIDPQSFDPNLKAEKSEDANLIVRHRAGSTQTTLSLFDQNIKDAIFSFSGLNQFGTVVTSYKNVDQVRQYGVELIVEAKDVLIQGLDVDANLAWIDAKTIKNASNPAAEGVQFPRIPKWRSNGTLRYRIADPVKLALGWRSASRPNSDLFGRVRGDAFGFQSEYLTVDARLNWRLTPRLELGAGIDNLFKPQIDHWEERAFRNLPTLGAVAPDAQVDAALTAWPGASFQSYRLPEHPGDAAMVHLALPAGEEGQAMRDVFVSPQGRVLASLDPECRIMEVVQRLHGQLLIGKKGSWLVELAASWAIVMILTGLYLWWPKGRGAAGVIWPRLSAGRTALWRDAHAVTGFWVSGLAMILLLTGLPWADVWGSAFKAVRAEMGWVKGVQGWTIGGRPTGDVDHAEHDHAAMMASGSGSAMPSVSINQIVRQAHRANLDFPVVVTPPGQSLPFGGDLAFGAVGSAAHHGAVTLAWSGLRARKPVTTLRRIALPHLAGDHHWIILPIVLPEPPWARPA